MKGADIKHKKMKKSILTIVSALVCVVMYTSCSKSETDDYAKLKGSTWEAASNDGLLFVLRFVDDTQCTMMSGRADGSLSANQIPYTWEYGGNWLGIEGPLFLYHKEDSTQLAYSGKIENGKLNLIFYTGNIENRNLWFNRK